MKARIFCASAFLIGVFAFAQQTDAGKLPVSAYIKSAKIEILSGDLDRYEYAIELLDSLFMYYGPHAEGLYWMSQIMVDYTEKSSGPMQKAEPVTKMAAYIDSLHLCCANEQIDKKYKKDCTKYIETTDSLRSKYWAEFYNAGVNQMNAASESEKNMNEALDSSMADFSRTAMEAQNDSAIAWFELAIKIDPKDYRTYVGIGNVYDKKKDPAKALEWKQRGLDRASDRNQLLLSVAYGYIGLDRYCDAIPLMQEHVANMPEDVSTMYNISICYNRCEKPDSALVMYHRILTIDTANVDALSSVGRFWFGEARSAADSANNTDTTMAAKRKTWQGKRDAAFDSAAVYLKRASVAQPDEPSNLELYAVACAIREKWEDAAGAFKQLAELQPENVDNWASLGDVYRSLKDYKSAAAAYEKVVEIDPQKKSVWEWLGFLYNELGNTAKSQAAKSKAAALN